MGIDFQLVNDPESSGQDFSVVHTDDEGKLTDIEIVPVDLDE